MLSQGCTAKGLDGIIEVVFWATLLNRSTCFPLPFAPFPPLTPPISAQNTELSLSHYCEVCFSQISLSLSPYLSSNYGGLSLSDLFLFLFPSLSLSLSIFL